VQPTHTISGDIPFVISDVTTAAPAIVLEVTATK